MNQGDAAPAIALPRIAPAVRSAKRVTLASRAARSR